MEEEDRLDDMDLDEEGESGKCVRNKNVYSRKHSGSEGNKLGSNASKKIKFFENPKRSNQKVSPSVNGDKLPKPMKDSSADTDRFATRNMEKLGFLDKDRKDAKRRRPGDVDYDSRTLYLSPNFLKSLTEAKGNGGSLSQSTWIRFFFSRYCSKEKLWLHFSGLDVLISLSIASEYYEGKTCRLILSGSFANEVPRPSAKSLGHPVLKGDTLGDGTFVTNDITLGGSDHASFILLTSPNMGGKSTLVQPSLLGCDFGPDQFLEL